MDTAAIWLLRMFLKLLDLLDLNSLAGLLVKDVYGCREAKYVIFVNELDGTYACDASLWIGYVLWFMLLAIGFLAYKRNKRLPKV